MNRFLAILIPAATIAAFAASAHAAKLKVPGQYGTIQAAVSAANPGDVVRISPGTYDETLLILAKTDLRVEAKGKVVLDGVGGVTAVGIVGCDGVHLKGLKIRNADTGVRAINSAGVRVDHCLVEEIGLNGVWFENVSACTVESSRVRNAGGGVLVEDSFGCVVTDSRITDVEGVGVLAWGAQHSIVGNRFERVKQDAVSVGEGGVATGVLVADNRFRQCPSNAIGVDTGAGHSIIGNDVRGGETQGIFAKAPTSQLLIDDNRFKKVDGSALLLRCPDSVVSRNRTKKCQSGLVVQSAVVGTLFQENRLRKSSEYGIYNQATDNAFVGNAAAKNGFADLNDIELETDNVWVANVFGTMQ